MANNVTTPSAPKKHRRWLRALGWVFSGLVVLLVVVYFVATSSAFFKGFILPKVSASLNATVTVSDASISPFSQVVLHNLKVQTTGSEPLVSAPEVRLRYSLMDIIGGNMHVDEIALVSPTIALIENADGTKNVDPILKAQKEKPQTKPTPPAKPAKPVQIDIRKIVLSDGTIRNVKLYAGGKQDVSEIGHFTVTLDNLKNGQTGKLGISAEISVNNNPPAPGASGTLLAKLNGAFDLGLAADLQSASVKGNTHLDVTSAQGAMAQAAGFGASFDCDISPTDIKTFALRLQKGNAQLGELLVAGPLDMAKSEGHLTVELRNVDKQFLNLAGVSAGLDFGPTTINSTNDIQLAKAGSSIIVAGLFSVNKLQVTRTNQTTPTLDFRAEYNLAVDTTARTALLRTLSLSGMQNGSQMLQGNLSSPMTIAWGDTTNGVGDSSLNFAVTGFDLAAWKPFLGDSVSSGTIAAQMKLLSQRAGKLLAFDLNSQVANLSAGSGSNRITQANVTFQVSGKATDMTQFDLSGYKFEIARQNQTLLTASGSGKFNQASQDADFQLSARAMLAGLLQAVPRPDMSISSGTADLQVHITQTAQISKPPAPTTNRLAQVTGSFALSDFTGQFGSNVLRNFGTVADLDVAMTPEQTQIRKASGKVTQGQNAGGSFDISGVVKSNKSAQITAKLMNFNQNGLGAFLQPMLGDKKLVSVALNANANIQYDPQAASSIKADLQVTNLVVNDPKGQFPATPLEAKFHADTSLNKQILDVHQIQLGLTPTSRATNQILISGRVDMSDTKAIQGNLKLSADSLDLTTYYDLFAAQKKAVEQKPGAGAQTSAPAAPGAASPEKEPAAMPLPVRNFVADSAIRRIYLHEVEMADCQMTVKIDGGHIQINPCGIKLNGGPMSAIVDLDLGVPGWKYDVTFNAQTVPLTPLVDTFQPERKGQLGGTFTAQMKIAGAGITGASLQKNLTGQYDLSTTNLNLSVGDIKNPILKLLVNVVASIPELLRNPAGAATSLVGSLLGVPGSTGGLASDLAKSPINSIMAHGTIGSGKVNLQQTMVRCPAFQADAPGTVTLAEVLTNSTLQIPVSISLSCSIAQKNNLVPANTPTNAAYVKLPDFLTITGTEGNPGKKIDTLALFSMAGNAAGVGGTAGQVIQGVEGIFGGGKSSATASNQAPAQPSGGLGGLLQGLGNAVSGTRSPTNAPSGKPVTNPPSGGLLNNLFNPK